MASGADPSGGGATMPRMYVARLTCSDAACAAELDAEAATLDELETLICDCGCALEVIAWPDWVDEPAVVVALRIERGDGSPPLRDAA
jgi:hypothetical protein